MRGSTIRKLISIVAGTVLLGAQAMAADGLTTIPSSYGPKETMDRRARAYRPRARARRQSCCLGRDPPMSERRRRIGPLVADDRAAAEATFAALLAAGGAGEVLIDVPSINSEAVALARDHGLAPVFETARMYTGAIRPVRLERVFGVTTFELG